MLFRKKEKEIEEAQKRARSVIPEILPLLDRLPSDKVDDVEDFLDANIADAKRKVEKLNGNNGLSKKEAP